MKNRSTIFTLGSRGNVLTSDLEEPVIVPHAAQKSEKKVRGFNYSALKLSTAAVTFSVRNRGAFKCVIVRLLVEPSDLVNRLVEYL